MKTLLSKLQAWNKRNRFAVQIFALLLALLSPFVLYAALASAFTWLAVLAFTLFTCAMALTFWAG